MKIAVLKETRSGETRVAATPETVKKYISLGATVAVQAGAGEGASFADADYAAAGASISPSAADAVQGAEVILKVQAPSSEELRVFPRGAKLIGIMSAHNAPDSVAGYARLGLDALAMELMPRITRAQSMDVLSSQSNLAGYKAVIDAAAYYGRAFPMMMTAAGTIAPAKVFVMGAGVAGLQAIATARRLGAVVSATDVRFAAKEQVNSLGATFVVVDEEAMKESETAGGYAKEMSAEFQARQAEFVAAHIAKQDIVITTALIPGRPAPRLVSAEMVQSMKAGSVIVDLAVEAGGNVELSREGEAIETGGVTILGFKNVPGRLAADASSLYARNIYNFIAAFFDKERKSLNADPDDDIIKGIALTRGGAVVHPAFASETAAVEPEPVALTPSEAMPDDTDGEDED
ncbi:Re/Si-specific NAD(P)(+) transhydrogenase subunit alpha [Hyphococcus sp.]|uniref:Re/Si-specific NAD(P)(+) transhydrogenase subunit alpha n=1 Tax=Hyphococcus sp. TaxID=2038636 RepID=UPI00207F3907|nr:MAG: NAD(P) transhydrogenase subunit alpha [Marinicaulis sp.]